jgi:hypothetical protein
MNRVLACILLSTGTVLVVYGLNALNSVSIPLARLIGGARPEPAFWFLLAGIAAVVIGIGALFRAPGIRPAVSRRDQTGVPQARRRPGNL